MPLSATPSCETAFGAHHIPPWLDARQGLAAIVGTIASAGMIGVPTDIIDTSLFTRMTPVRWWDYVFWIISSVLAGAIVSTYVPRAGMSAAPAACTTRTVGGGVLSAFAVGCPICNQIVVAAIGVSGALT